VVVQPETPPVWALGVVSTTAPLRRDVGSAEPDHGAGAAGAGAAATGAVAAGTALGISGTIASRSARGEELVRLFRQMDPGRQPRPVLVDNGDIVDHGQVALARECIQLVDQPMMDDYANLEWGQ
jgi:hypothetical protein